MNVRRSCPLSERSCLYEIQNRKKYCAGDAGSPTVFPKAVLGIVPKPLSGRDGGSSDRPDRLRLFRGREKFPQPDAAVWCAGGGHAAVRSCMGGAGIPESSPLRSSGQSGLWAGQHRQSLRQRQMQNLQSGFP